MKARHDSHVIRLGQAQTGLQAFRYNLSNRVGWGLCLIPLTEPYVRTSYTAHAFFTFHQIGFLNDDGASQPVTTRSIEYNPSSSNQLFGME